MIILGMFGGVEIVVILIAVLILFGGKKIPELMRNLGKGINDIKKDQNIKDVTDDISDITSNLNKFRSPTEFFKKKK